MCGIAGCVAFRSWPDRSVAQAMCDAIRHRGPDGEGYYCDEDVVLGHRRLSIIDVAGGSQPLANEDGTIQVIFNGEIYNYRELMAGLIARGHRFRTRSDTEVLVHLYEEAGERLPEYLNGMFAFAIWDAPRRRLFLARDRFGEKPLYYTTAITGMTFCFASELKAMAILPGFPTGVNARAIADFLTFHYVPDPDTIYKHVHKLEAGRSLTVSPGGITGRTYWQPTFAIDAGAAFDDAVQRLRSLAQEAVAMRMISDVPLGGFLSGGVDSSAVAAFMAMRAPERVKTFSIGFTDKRYDELDFARKVATLYETEHYEEVVSPSMHDVLDTLIRHYDEPFGDSSAIPTLYLAAMTRRHVTVALSGDGADEVFGGYRRYAMACMEDRVRRVLPVWFRSTAVRLAAERCPKFDYLPRAFRAKATLNGIAQGLPDAYFSAMSWFRDEGLEAVLAPELRREMGGYSPRERFRERFRKYSHLPALRQIQAVDLETYLPGDILVKVDRATMAYSLESRAPWLDHRIVELAFGLPVHFNLNGRSGKYILKKAVEPYLPRDITTRSKMGFSVPLKLWFRTSLKPIFESLVLSPRMEEYVRLAEVRRVWEEHQSGMWDHTPKLWDLLMLAGWDAHHRQRVGILMAVLGSRQAAK